MMKRKGREEKDEKVDEVMERNGVEVRGRVRVEREEKEKAVGLDDIRKWCGGKRKREREESYRKGGGGRR